jgi:hypothetical protein
MKAGASRRSFIRGMAGVAAIGAGGCLSSGKRRGGGAPVRLAAAGVGGKGLTDWLLMLESGGAELVALCDCDSRKLDEVADNPRFAAYAERTGFDLGKIPFYTDYRRLLDDTGILGVQAMTVSTTDHTHAPIAIPAMKAGIHVFVQTPLARTLWETGYFADVARECGVVTQMGNQGSSVEGFRRGVDILRSGLIGDAVEVHAWTNRPVWPQGVVGDSLLNGPGDTIPEGFNWNAWLSTAAERPYRELYRQYRWRGLLDFGTGALGDMGCHLLNLPFRGLELGECNGATVTFLEDAGKAFFPARSTLRLSFPQRTSPSRGVPLPPVSVFWHDGGGRPSPELMPQVVAAGLCEKESGEVPSTGCLVVGSNGVLFSMGGYGCKNYVALAGEDAVCEIESHPACIEVAAAIPRRDAPPDGSGDAQCLEFISAINGVGPTYADTGSRCWSDTGCSLPLADAVLVGVTAQRLANAKNGGVSVAWNSAARTFDSVAATALAKPKIRRGFDF